MTHSKPENENKALHDLIEDELQRLIDIIEQKQILHESIHIDYGQNETSPEKLTNPMEAAAKRLKQHSQTLGAETLAEYFQELQYSAQKDDLSNQDELLRNISDEFEKVKAILSESAN